MVLTFLLTRTAWGRHVYAVGGNAEAARRAGINVKGVKLSCFVMCSTLAAVAGMLLASRDNSVSPTTGGSLTLLYAVGAAVIGGTSLFGGKGRVVDAVIGGLRRSRSSTTACSCSTSRRAGSTWSPVGAAARGQRRRDQPPTGSRHRTGLIRPDAP